MNKILLVVFLFLSLTAFAQNRTTPYDFPVKPETAQWKFSSTEEMYNKCQIPVDIINILTTDALAKTCLNYPLFGLKNAFNTPQAGFSTVRKNFNGIDKLFERKDAGKILLNIYLGMKPENIDKSLPLVKQGEFTESFRNIEILLAQNIVQANMEDSDKKVLLKELKAKYDGKIKTLDVFGYIGLQSTLFPAAKIMDKKGLLKVKNNSTISFLETGQLTEEADLTELYNRLNVNQ